MRGYWRKVWLGFYTVLLGMKVTVKYLFSPSITLQYPDERWEIPDGNRGKLDCNMDDCIGCMQCSRACPVECITIEIKKPPPGVDLGKTSGGTQKKLLVPVFDIDLTKCLFCGLCVEPCPTNCIRMTKEYEYSVYDRSQLLLSFGKEVDISKLPRVPVVKPKAAAPASEKAGAGESPKAAKAKPPAAGTGAEPKAEATAGAPQRAVGPGEAGREEKASGGAAHEADAGGDAAKETDGSGDAAGKAGASGDAAARTSGSGESSNKGSTSSDKATEKTPPPPGDS